MQRISVVGPSGSGKTTLAIAIAERLRLPRLELDGVYHQANWTPLPGAEFRARVSAYAEQPRWVIDGNYATQGVLDLVWQRADAVVWLDLPKHVVLRQILWRSLSRALLGTELWNGNRERLWSLLRGNPEENVVLWAITSFERLRERYAARMRDPQWAHVQFHRLRSKREWSAFLTRLDHP